MNHLLKAIVVLIGSMLVNIAINIICNMNGVELNSIVMTFTTTLVTLTIYHAWIEKEIVIIPNSRPQTRLLFGTESKNSLKNFAAILLLSA